MCLAALGNQLLSLKEQIVSSAQIVSARLVRGVAPDGPSLMWVIFKTAAPYFFIARLKNAQVDRSFPQVPLRFISDGIHIVGVRSGRIHGHGFGGFPHLNRGKALFVLEQSGGAKAARAHCERHQFAPRPMIQATGQIVDQTTPLPKLKVQATMPTH